MSPIFVNFSVNILNFTVFRTCLVVYRNIKIIFWSAALMKNEYKMHNHRECTCKRDVTLANRNTKSLIVSRTNAFHQKQETAKDGMAGLQSGKKIWKDWLRSSLNTMVNLRYCMTLKFEWTKSRSQKHQTKIWEDTLTTNLNAKVNQNY